MGWSEDASSLMGPRLKLSTCPASIFCHKCEGLCPKECKVGTKTIDSVQATQDLVGCTHVEGSLILNLRQGCQYSSWPRPWPRPPWPHPPSPAKSLAWFPLIPPFLPRLSLQLPSLWTHHLPWPAPVLSFSSPDNLEPELQRNLGLVETITGFLKIKHSFALVTLGFFKNLKLIRGDSMVDG